MIPAPEGPVLPYSFYERDTVTVAKNLLGNLLVHGDAAGRIVEVEAYLGEGDLAAHASRGITDRTRVIFGPAGHAYVYFIYGMYECLNIVAEPEGRAGCILIRAIEPVRGVELMRKRRPAAARMEDLASGPGRLTLALGITRALNGASVVEGPVKIHAADRRPVAIATSPRIGITQCADWPLRFYEEGNRFVSRMRSAPG